MLNLKSDQRGQLLIETAVALPILIILFMGCVQLVQIGIAHIVVLDAVYEAGRQAGMDQGDTVNAGRVAGEICRSLGPGTTEFICQKQSYIVTHYLKPLFAVVKNVKVRHACPVYLFRTEQR
ncbi:pilus assembly protein [bacterium]|nr:pilus assembly protein [bacterium]